METQQTHTSGSDLHDTLLDHNWEIVPELMDELIEIIEEIKSFCKNVICTGNDYAFVKKHVPQRLLDALDGAVIETGTAFVDENEKEHSLVTAYEQHVINQLNLDIQAAQFHGQLPDFKHFGERKHSISAFTKDENGGVAPEENLLPVIEEIVNKTEYADDVTVTYSSVAVDVFPKRLNKATGLREVANGGKTIGIADSMNDFALILESDYSFVPLNATQALLDELVKRGKRIVSLDNIRDEDIHDPDIVFQATQNDTKGVIEIFKFIRDNLKPNNE